MDSQMNGHDELAPLASTSALPHRPKRLCRYYRSPKGKLRHNHLFLTCTLFATVVPSASRCVRSCFPFTSEVSFPLFTPFFLHLMTSSRLLGW